jgi:hypothetical protein
VYTRSGPKRPDSSNLATLKDHVDPLRNIPDMSTIAVGAPKQQLTQRLIIEHTTIHHFTLTPTSYRRVNTRDGAPTNAHLSIASIAARRRLWGSAHHNSGVPGVHLFCVSVIGRSRPRVTRAGHAWWVSARALAFALADGSFWQAPRGWRFICSFGHGCFRRS